MELGSHSFFGGCYNQDIFKDPKNVTTTTLAYYIITSGTPEVCLLPAGMAPHNKITGAASSSVCKYYKNKIITRQYGSAAVPTVVKVSSSVSPKATR